MKLVLCPEVDSERFVKIQAAGAAIEVVNCSNPEQAESEIADADAFIGKLTPPMLKAARRLKWVQAPTASLEHYVFPELIEHPCALTNMRGLFSDVIADHVFGFMLAFTRNLHVYIRRQHAARWEAVGGEESRPSVQTGPSRLGPIERAHLCLADLTLGVVGVGAIGEEIARRARVFGMRALGIDALRTEPPEGIESLWKPERLPDLLAESDFVVIAAPHTPETEKMFRAGQFRAMKSTACLINIGRGIIVDLADLTAALAAGEIAGAALDVYEIEPLPSDHPLWKMENVILTPHIAGYSPRVAERHLEVLLDNVGRFTRGDPLRNVVDKAKWF